MSDSQKTFTVMLPDCSNPYSPECPDSSSPHKTFKLTLPDDSEDYSPVRTVFDELTTSYRARSYRVRLLAEIAQGSGKRPWDALRLVKKALDIAARHEGLPSKRPMGRPLESGVMPREKFEEESQKAVLFLRRNRARVTQRAVAQRIGMSRSGFLAYLDRYDTDWNILRVFAPTD